MFERKVLKERAKIAFKSNYWMSVLIAALLTIATASATSKTTGSGTEEGESVIHMFKDTYALYGNYALAALAIVASISIFAVITAFAFKIFVSNPYEVGLKTFFLKNHDIEKPKFKDAFATFKDNYVNVCKVIFIKDLVITLFTLLLIVPGLIKIYELRMVEYILAEDHSVSYREAALRSKEMMMGNKWAAFVLDLSFIGWQILGGILFPVALLWSNPYIYQTDAELYLELKNY